MSQTKTHNNADTAVAYYQAMNDKNVDGMAKQLHPNVELIRYAEAWAQRFQFNTEVETIHEVAKRPHRDPLVTVAIRSDGSVESVTFELPSGVAEVDDAIRHAEVG